MEQALDPQEIELPTILNHIPKMDFLGPGKFSGIPEDKERHDLCPLTGWWRSGTRDPSFIEDQERCRNFSSNLLEYVTIRNRITGK